ncbi:MAG: NHL repeat-containing protein [Calditrichaeota bacterium]|nr:NHL repeat-containing protein [Calditrichota bacterium]
MKAHTQGILLLLILPLFAPDRAADAKDLGVIQPYLILGGTQGAMIEQFDEPDAVAFMNDGRLLAGDTLNGRFKIYTILEDGLTIKTIGTPGKGDCQFDNSLVVVFESGREIYNEVQGIACNSKDEIYIVDQGNHRIQVFGSDGACLPGRSIDLSLFLVAPDPMDGTIYTSIQGLVIGHRDHIYLTDTGTRRVYKFQPDGRPDKSFDFQAKEDGKWILEDPESMLIWDDMLLVADEGHQVIKIFDRMSGRFTGKTIGHRDLFGGDVEGLAKFENYLFAVNEEFSGIAIFDLSKNGVPLIAQFGEKGLTPGRFLSPDGLAISKDGKYLVMADQGNFRLQVFLLEPILDSLK